MREAITSGRKSAFNIHGCNGYIHKLITFQDIEEMQGTEKEQRVENNQQIQA